MVPHTGGVGTTGEHHAKMNSRQLHRHKGPRKTHRRGNDARPIGRDKGATLSGKNSPGTRSAPPRTNSAGKASKFSLGAERSPSITQGNWSTQLYHWREQCANIALSEQWKHSHIPLTWGSMWWCGEPSRPGPHQCWPQLRNKLRAPVRGNVKWATHAERIMRATSAHWGRVQLNRRGKTSRWSWGDTAEEEALSYSSNMFQTGVTKCGRVMMTPGVKWSHVQ